MELFIMKPIIFTVLLATLWTARPATSEILNFDPMLNVFKESLQGIMDNINDLKKVVGDLSRQTMLQQLAMEERSRINSGSGIESIRSSSKGLKNYESHSFTGNNVFAIHDHSNFYNTIGLGEVSVLMNGVNFRTRHNDYKLVMPSTTSKEYRATEPIPYPEVPPSVKGTLEEQVQELSEWFKAFKTQDYSVRDYRQFFKPVLCYLEGTWTLDKDLQEPFSSDRHQLDASSWFDLQEKVQFSAYSGTKSLMENIAYLPTSILSVNQSTGLPNYAQWNYRILCKPTKKDVPLSMLKYVDDLSYRMRDGRSVAHSVNSRAARFKLYDESKSDSYQLLDELFYDVPGMDNLPEDNLNQTTFEHADLYEATSQGGFVPLKTGYYHRQYKSRKRGAMGLTVNSRGFNDENMWVAQTTQGKVAPLSITTCKRTKKATKGYKKVCGLMKNRFSYAIPLEIVYMTPLLTWNPFDLEFHQDTKSAAPTNEENGGSKPYHGVDQKHFYMTPYQIFQRKKGRNARNLADTTRGQVNVLDRNNQIQRVVASGTRILLDEIKNVGLVRLRYPIAPVADEGSNVWKELNALKDYVYAMASRTNQQTELEPTEVQFEMSVSRNSTTAEHSHTFVIPYVAFKDLVSTGNRIKVVTDAREGHSHSLIVTYSAGTKTFRYQRCDQRYKCFDMHPRELFVTTTSVFTRL